MKAMVRRPAYFDQVDPFQTAMERSITAKTRTYAKPAFSAAGTGGLLFTVAVTPAGIG
jgi:hypothetical protein